MRKLARAGVVAVSSLAAAVALASPASAASYSGPVCTTLSNGALCLIVGDGGKVHVTYTKGSGGNIDFKLGYRKGNFTKFSEPLSMGRGAKAYDFNHQNIGCSSIVGVLSVADQGKFETPPLQAPSC